MTTKRVFFLSAAAVFLLTAVSPLEAKSGKPWIHIRVTERDGTGAKVSVNLPFSVVQIAVEAAPEKFISDGFIRVNHCAGCRISVADLRRMWQELRDSGETELISVEDDDDNVTVRREGELIRIDVVDSGDDNETVHVKVPIAVVDAMLSGEGKELNLREALEQLKDQRGEIVRVEGGDSDVRIWIDERN